MIIYPILASILGSSELILSKFFLSKFKVKSREYLTSDFLVIILSMSLFIPLFYQNPTFLKDTKLLLYFIGVIAIGIFGNYFYIKAISFEEITALQPFRIFSPFFGIIIAALFFREELTILNVSLLVVATLALLFSQKSFFELKKSKGIMFIIISIVLFSFEPFFIKELLIDFNPFMLYYVRAVFVFVILYFSLRPKLIVFEKEKTKLITTISVMSTIKRVLLYFSYLYLGVLNTLLITKIRYPLEYLLAVISLKEKLEIRNVISSVVILVSVVVFSIYSQS